VVIVLNILFSYIMASVRNIRNKLASLKKLQEEETTHFQEWTAGRARNIPPRTYRQQIANTERQLKAAIGPRSGLGLELNRARNNLKKLKSKEEINKIKVREAPKKYRGVIYGSVYQNPLVALKINYFNSLPKNVRNAIDKKLKNALNAHNKKIENAEKRVKNIENFARKRAGRLLAKTPGMGNILAAPNTGILWARWINTLPGGPKLPKTAVELAAYLRKHKRNWENQARSPKRHKELSR
jgi:hypothetical protein